jgi:DNA-binding CsgD family transcriptional regulator
MASTRTLSPRRRRRSKQTKKSRSDPIARERALEAVHLMRTYGYSLTRAARAAGTTVRTVRKYLPRALRKMESGRYRATPSDRYTRRMFFDTEGGRLAISVRGSRAASRIARHVAAVDRYLRTGSTEALQEFEGQTVKAGRVTYPFITDPVLLDRLAHAGEFSFESVYALRA